MGNKHVIDWKNSVAAYLNFEIRKKVCIAENTQDGNYYIWPYVTFGMLGVAGLPIKVLRILDTGDEALFEAAVEMMDYCRLPTIEEIEECEIIGCSGETISDDIGFKKITGRTMTWFDKKCPNLILSDRNDGRYEFRLYNPVRCYFCNKDATPKEKAAMLRDVLGQW